MFVVTIGTDKYTGKAGQEYFDAYRAELLSPEIGQRKADKLNAYLDPSWSIVDFGCSAGQITAKLKVREKVGVEVSEAAVRVAREAHGLQVVRTLDELPASTYDAVVTHHVLEHVVDPIRILLAFQRILKSAGKAIIVVPGEAAWYPGHNHWREEINKHLFSWTPLTLGNLCVSAGFVVDVAKPLTYTEPSRYFGPLRHLPMSRKVMGRLRQYIRGENEVLLVAHKP